MAKRKREIPPIMKGPRCGAKTRSGKPCQAPAANGYRRCRMHGGAPGSGAPKGNQNAKKHGLYTAKEIAARRRAKLELNSAKLVLEYSDQVAAAGGPQFVRPTPAHIAAVAHLNGLNAEQAARLLQVLQDYYNKGGP